MSAEEPGVETDQQSVNELTEIQLNKLKTKIFHIHKELFKSLKKAKADFTKKTVRRLNTLRKKLEEITTDESEKLTSLRANWNKEIAKLENEWSSLKLITFNHELASFCLKNFFDTFSAIEEEVVTEKKKNPVLDEYFGLLKTHQETLLSFIPKVSKISDEVLIPKDCKASQKVLESKFVKDELSIAKKELTAILSTHGSLKKQVQKDQKELIIKKKGNKIAVKNSDDLFVDSLGNDADVLDQYQGDSDISESEDERIHAEPVKKNRKGQRARREEWERKFGNKANHVIKEKEAALKQKELEAKIELQKQKQQSNLHPSWQAKKSIRQSITIGAKPAGNKIVFGQESQDVPKKETAPTDEKIHPSWQAKLNKKSSIVGFQGKKIVFGEAEDDVPKPPQQQKKRKRDDDVVKDKRIKKKGIIVAENLGNKILF